MKHSCSNPQHFTGSVWESIALHRECVGVYEDSSMQQQGGDGPWQGEGVGV